MLKLYALSAFMLYAFACYGTMPSQCFTPRFAFECQRVQVSQIAGWRASVDWDHVDSVRVIR